MENTEYYLARILGKALLARHWQCAAAESCTGGRVAAAITDISGSSQWFERGFVTYANQAKIDMLGVSAELLNKEGAVSEAVVRAMAEGALTFSQADVVVAITGIAGPNGGSVEKPVGLVWFAWAQRGGITSTQAFHFKGDRSLIRQQAVHVALEGLIQEANSKEK